MNLKITQLPVQTATGTAKDDVLPIVSVASPVTNKIKVSELFKLLTADYFTISPTDVSNGFITLSKTPFDPTMVQFDWAGSGCQIYGGAKDFTVAGNVLTFGTRLAAVIASGQEFRAVYAGI